jgi:hypothetical protein
VDRTLQRTAILVGLFVTALSSAALAAEAGKLPPGTLRGPEHRLEQYPTLSLASPAQRVAAARLLTATIAGTRAWRDAEAAAAAGFDLHTARRAPRTVGYLHAEHRAFRNDRRNLDTRRPETLIYANVPGRPLVLIGVMFGVPRGVHGPTPGGPITRWHTHRVCVRGDRRGLTPRADGSCPTGTVARQGSEMLHVWFTKDLRSAYAIHAPEPELCVAGLLPPGHCTHVGHHP